MNSRQIAEVLLLGAGLSILVLLMIPVVHLPCVVIHGPTTAMRAQRAASLLIFLMRQAGLIFAGMLALLSLSVTWPWPDRPIPITNSEPLTLSCALRC